MNKRFKYEQIISEHLDNISIPNMQDIIWHKIEKGLIHAEVNQTSNNTITQKELTRISYKRIFLDILIQTTAFGLLSLFIVQFNTNRSQKSPPIENFQQFQENEFPKKMNRKNFIRRKKNKMISNLSVDSLDFLSPKINPNIDSIIVEKKALFNPILEIPKFQKLLEPEFNKKDSSMRKARGVIGISDSDYFFKQAHRDTL